MDKRTASYLLPDPGGKVVRELLDQIEKRDADLRKVLKKWYQYEWSGEQDSLYIDLKKLLEDE